MKPSDRDGSVVPRHLEDSDLLEYLDGEMLADELKETRFHLESCWKCRSRLSRIQGSIDTFLLARQENLLPDDVPPSDPAVEQFRRKLADYTSAAALQPSLLRATVRRWHALTDNLSSYTRAILSAPPPLAVKLASLLLVLSAVAYVVFFSNKVTTVTASELLQRAQDARAQQMRATAGPVVHQKLNLRRRTTNEDVSAGLEIWTDPVASQFKKTVESSTTAVAELERLYHDNAMDWRQPLSAESYQAWRRSITIAHEAVTRSHVGGVEVVSLRTTVSGPIAIGKIGEGTFVVRASDWHPIKEHWTVNGASGYEEYELSESSFEIVSSKSLSPAFFSAGEKGSKATANTNSGLRTTPIVTSESHISPSSVAASADLEVEVLRLLNEAHANLGEQINVTRTSDQRLYVHGVVETTQRKNEILATLQPVIANPAVVVNIVTVAEASTQTTKSNTVTIQGGTVTENATIPVHAQLRAHLLARGISEDKLDENIRQISSQFLQRSRQVLRHGWAIRNVSSGLTQANINELSPEARLKWLDLINQHARAIQRETESLHAELAAIFPDLAKGTADVGPIETDADLSRALARLVQTCASNDGTIRVAFTVSSTTTTSGLQSPQFWESLRLAEELSAKTQSAIQKFRNAPRP
jgi:hypothetical protein